ncbi:MAG: VOC family protein [Bacteroidota bacterium]
MQHLQRLLPNLCTDDLAASKAFYTRLFAFEIAYDSDWFVQLQSPDAALELGLIARDSDFVPAAARGAATGFYLTLVVDDVELCFERAQQHQYPIEQAPADTPYGQRRMLLRDPNGVLLDVSSPIADFQPRG